MDPREERLEFEWGKLKFAKETIKNGIENTLNHANFRNVGRYVKYDLYKPEHENKYLNITLAKNFNFWTVTVFEYEQNSRLTSIFIHNGNDLIIGNKCLAFYYLPIEKDNRGHAVFESTDKDSFDIACAKYKIEVGDTSPEYIAYKNALEECNKFVTEIKDRVYQAVSNLSWKNYINRMKKIFEDYSQYTKDTLEINNAITVNDVTKFVKIDFTDMIDSIITINHSSEKDIELFKRVFMVSLKRSNHAFKEASVRAHIKAQVKKVGIDEYVKNIEIDSSIDLGSFDCVQKLIIGQSKTYDNIIDESFKNITDLELLAKSINQLLKLYYEYRHINEQNATRLAKFLIDNSLTKSIFTSKVKETEAGGRYFRNHSNSADNLSDITHRYLFVAKIRKSVANKQNSEGKWIKEESTAEFNDLLIMRLLDLVPAFNLEHKHRTEIGTITGNSEDNTIIIDAISYERKDAEKTTGARLADLVEMYNEKYNDVLFLKYIKVECIDK